MDRATQNYYDARFDLFSKEGWREWIKEIQEFETTINNVDGVKTVEDLWFRKGQMDMIRYILHLETVSRATHDRLLEEAKEVTDESSE